jgi:hypothetical protein
MDDESDSMISHMVSSAQSHQSHPCIHRSLALGSCDELLNAAIEIYVNAITCASWLTTIWNI